MTRFLLSLLIGAALLAGIPAQAFWQSRGSNYNISISSGSTYVGPADIVANPTAWYSCTRGVSAAYSTGSNKACNVRRASDNTTQDINILANGNFDVASYNTFVGTDATGTCTIATTTLSCTGLGSALHNSDLITGAGITNPCILSSVGSLVGGAQTATAQIAGTTNSCGTVSVGETVVAQVAGLTTKMYDQSGASACSAAHCDVSQATAGNQPQVLPVCVNSVPCVWNIATTGITLTNTTGITPATGVVSFSVTTMTPGASTLAIIKENNNNNRLSTTGGDMLMNGASGSITAAAANSAWHATNAAMNGASSYINVDGTETTGTTTGNTTNNFIVVTTGGTTAQFFGEVGFWDNLAFTHASAGSQAGLTCGNQATYYATTIGTNC